jgi:hypothetical protein
VLLLVVGVAVSQLAAYARHLKVVAITDAGYLLHAAATAWQCCEVTVLTGAPGPGVRRLEYEGAGHLGPAAEALVPIDQIVGTVEPTRFFDRHFRPTSEVPRTRFERIAADILSGRGMDPVDLYRCGGQYYVLDGRHRIAVARALGERWVLANITDVRLNHPGGPNLG